ncbi:MAG: hypothetical protein PHD58_08935 [Anaerolineales bacterium]|nr:hypothetical protein [Anaerolineales bacterium]
MAPKIFADWRQNVIFSPEGPTPTPLYADGPVKVVLAGLQAGGAIPPHPEGLSVYHFLEGRGRMQVNAERLDVQAGMTVILDAGDVRGLEADTDLAFLATRLSLPGNA